MAGFEERAELVNRFIHKYGRLPTERDPEYLEMLQMSKYQISDVPTYKPAKCGNCGSSKNDGRKYVDFGLEIDWYGTLYLCDLCLKDVAKKMGLFKEYEQKIEMLVLEKELLKKQLEQGAELPDKLVQAWEEFKEYYDSVSTVRVDPSASVILSTDSESPIQELNETESDKSGTDATEQTTTKSTTSSGRKNLRSLAELLDNP